MDNAADRKSIRRKEKDSRVADRHRREVIASIMSTMAGRHWLWDRLSETSIFHTTHVGGNALESAFQEGRRSVGLSLLADIMAHCPDQYIQAMREANERSITDAVRSANADDADPAPTGFVDPAEGRTGEPDRAGGDSAEGPSVSYTAPGADIYVERPSEA